MSKLSSDRIIVLFYFFASGLSFACSNLIKFAIINRVFVCSLNNSRLLSIRLSFLCYLL